MTAQQLNGSQRVLLDGVIGEHECEELQRLSNVSSDLRKEKPSGKKLQQQSEAKERTRVNG